MRNHNSDDRSGDRLAAYLAEARSHELPPAELCAKVARAYARRGDSVEAYRWLGHVVDGGDSFVAWAGAAALLDEVRQRTRPPAIRSVKVAVTGSYTTTQLASLFRLAALRRGIDVDLFEGSYGQYRQDLIDPASPLYIFEPDYVLLAVHAGAAELPELADSPREAVESEMGRWRGLWDRVAEHSNAHVIQHTFAIPPELPLGHLSGRVASSRHRMLQEVNARLQDDTPDGISFVDAERLASDFGKSRWFDPRYWFRSKQAVSLEALPLLARHCAAVLAARLGLSRKCLVLDLDNTLWGGVIGEDGLTGITLGAGEPRGETYVSFQEYVLRLKERGVVLAVASKNNPDDAREPFERHPDMRLRLDDFAIFIANWDDKPANLRRIASGLDLGLDSLVLADDNPVERQAVRDLLPEVEVVPLEPDPASFTRTLADCLLFEPATLTREDRDRSAQYRARAQALDAQTRARSIEDFYRDLDMRALVAPFDELNLPRIVQLIGKTNQFNLTTRRHDLAAIRSFMSDREYVHAYLRLRDRFADHGLVGVLIARRDGDALEIDTWLMSCRVIGRTVENEMLSHLCRRAEELDCSRLRGVFIPSPKNHIVRDIYAKFGFQFVGAEGGAITWEYNVAERGPITSPYIAEWEAAYEPV